MTRYKRCRLCAEDYAAWHSACPNCEPSVRDEECECCVEAARAEWELQYKADSKEEKHHDDE
jgi:hypothetical protein